MASPTAHSAFRFDSPGGAVEAILALVRPVGGEVVPLAEAHGRVLSAPVRTDRPSPAVDVSSMDGFAVRRKDLSTGRLAIAGEVRIGSEPPRMPAGAGGGPACLRLVTGGAVPDWADAVVKREDVREGPDAIEFDPSLAQRVKPGAYVRRRGENAAAGDEVVPSGTLITPAVAGALSAVGLASVPVHRALRIGVLITGDEVLPTDAPPSPWQLRDSNGPALSALLHARGWIGGVEAHHIDDSEARLDALLAALLPRVDALLLTGGVSAGGHDYVPGALARAGVGAVVHGVPHRPGRPILAGVTADGRPVLGLPGNPVSTIVTARRMGMPVLARRAGLVGLPPRPVVSLSNPDGQSLHLWWHRPVRMVGPGLAALEDTRGSGDLIAAARTDGFVEIPPGESGAGPWPYYGWSDG